MPNPNSGYSPEKLAELEKSAKGKKKKAEEDD
jgi:hypothetical protein